MFNLIIVDDDPFILSGMERIVPWDRYQFHLTALLSNGEEAMNYLKRNLVHLLITDIKMPGISGLDLLRFMNKERLPTRSIVLSAYNDFSIAKDALSFGIENYLTKPVEISELTMTLSYTVEKLHHDSLVRHVMTEGLDVIRNNILYRFVTGQIEEEEWVERKQVLKLGLDSPRFAIGLLSVQPSSGRDKADTDILQILEELGKRLLDSSEFKGYLFPDYQGSLILLATLEQDEMQYSEIGKFIEQLSEQLNIETGKEVSATIGPVVEQSSKLSISLKGALRMQQYQLSFPQHAILYYHMIPESMLSDSKLQDSPLFSPVVERVVQFTNSHYMKNISLQKLAQDIRINSTYLGQLFKKETGMLFKDYVNLVRLKEAKKMLMDTTWKISDIGTQVGFENISYFYTLFRQKNGLSPNEYRMASLVGLHKEPMNE